MSDVDVYQSLRADSGVSAIIAARLYWNYRPQDTELPCIVITRISGSQQNTFAGPLAMDDALYRLLLICADPDSRRDLGAAVLAWAEAKFGPVVAGDTRIDGLFVQESGADSYERDRDGSDEAAFRRIIDVRIIQRPDV